jgi:hypothetical protein
MTQPFLAYIFPLATGGQPDQGLPGQPPGIWPSPGHPAHPIAPGGPPPGVWPGPGYPTHPIAPGGPPPRPSHPIVIPPDALGPGTPSHPIVIPPEIWPQPGVPSHPIVIPPDAIAPGTPSQPIYIPPEIWPGPGRPDQGLPGSQPQPEHPIYLPELPEIPTDALALVLVKIPGQEPVYCVINLNNEVKPLPPVAAPKTGRRGR